MFSNATLQERPNIHWQASASYGRSPHQVTPESFSANSHHAIDATLSRIYEAANEDVEMKDAFDERHVYLVLDTNILIDCLDVMKRFNEKVGTHGLPITIIIPSVVLSELDGLKKRETVGSSASRASAWILDKMMERKTLKVQSRRETCNVVLAGHERERKNDIYIYDCCRFFAQCGFVIFVTKDRNLGITVGSINTDTTTSRATLFSDIVTIVPDKSGNLSQALARRLAEFGINTAALHLDEEKPNYRRSRSGNEGGNNMDVDEEVVIHALNALHLRVVDHFERVLKNLALRRGAGDLEISKSQHAQGYRRRAVSMWSAGDCVEFLNTKASLRQSSPPLHIFLLRRSEAEGWRRGQDWSSQDWRNCTSALHEIGTKFNDGVVLGLVEDLRQEMDYVFRLPLRPTGQ